VTVWQQSDWLDICNRNDVTTDPMRSTYLKQLSAESESSFCSETAQDSAAAED